MAQMKVSPGGTPSSGTFLCSTVVTTVSTYSSTLRLSKIQARLPDHVRKLVPTNSPGVTSQPILGLVARQFSWDGRPASSRDGRPLVLLG